MRPTPVLAAMAVLAAMVAVILTVLGFEHIGGYIPCKLCLGQRVPYYIAIPVAAVALAALWLRWPAWTGRAALGVAGLLMVWAAVLGARHAGVEWGWWEGPGDCGAVGGLSTNVQNMLKDLTATRAPSCTEAAGRFLGLSFAGWNVVASSAIAAIAFAGAWQARRD